jgi:hypothetical protein
MRTVAQRAIEERVVRITSILAGRPGKFGEDFSALKYISTIEPLITTIVMPALNMRKAGMTKSLARFPAALLFRSFLRPKVKQSESSRCCGSFPAFLISRFV